jgi:hypothetical protein
MTTSPKNEAVTLLAPKGLIALALAGLLGGGGVAVLQRDAAPPEGPPEGHPDSIQLVKEATAQVKDDLRREQAAPMAQISATLARLESKLDHLGDTVSVLQVDVRGLRVGADAMKSDVDMLKVRAQVPRK